MTNTTPFYPLQDFVYPAPQLGLPDSLYWKHRTNVASSNRQRFLNLTKHGYIDCESFFNSLSLSDWVNNCGIQDYVLRVAGAGEIHLDVHLVHSNGTTSLLLSEAVLLSQGSYCYFPLPIPLAHDTESERQRGYVFPTIFSVSGARITDLTYGTTTRPRREVRLGGVVTHFRREHLISPALARISTELATDNGFAAKFALAVVDNSRSLDDRTWHENIKILRNHNYGGAGGFTRGLLHFADQRIYTHVLFMDDDATLELASIKRAIVQLSYDVADTAAVSGTLFINPDKTLVYESGARLRDGLLTACGRGADVSLRAGLLELEIQRVRPEYGGWWFFAFPISNLKHFPFPYFVRGDDAAFGSSNNFTVRCPKGIACWGESFEDKDSPLNRYLDMRHSLRHSLLFDSGTFSQVVNLYAGWVKNLIDGFRYASAEACLLAMEDAFKPSNFWHDNIDLADLRNRMSGLLAEEKAVAPNPETHPELRRVGVTSKGDAVPESLIRGEVQGNWLRFVVRKATLNGLLLPRFLCPRKPVVLRKIGAAAPRLVFPYKSAIYVVKTTGKIFVGRQDVTRAIRLRLRLEGITRALKRDEPRLRTGSQQSFSELASESFWRKVYSRAECPL